MKVGDLVIFVDGNTDVSPGLILETDNVPAEGFGAITDEVAPAALVMFDDCQEWCFFEYLVPIDEVGRY